MKILNIQPSFYNKNIYTSNPNFKSRRTIENIRNVNLGSMSNGLIGTIEVSKSNGKRVLLDVLKSTYDKYETYRLIDEKKNVIGNIELYFNKYQWKCNNEKDHLFVSELRNFSNPKTPYYTKGLEEYKHVGTKLLQLAQKRSYENNCNGNIELIAKNRKEVVDFYKRLGFKQFENVPMFANPYRFYLAEENMDFLANLYGGL